MAEALTVSVFSIVIPHRDDHQGLRRTLEAVSRQMLPSGWRLELIVVDNSDAGTASSLLGLVGPSERPSVTLLTEARLGAAHARNAGASASTGELVGFLDCDCSPGPDWVGHAVQALTHSDVVGGPVLVETPGGRAPQSPAEMLDLLFGFNSRLSFARDGLLLTANIVMPRRVFVAVGPFQQQLSEDRDWCVRAAAAGFRLALDDAMTVGHAALACEGRLRARWARVTTETYHFLRAHGHGNLYWLAYLAKVAASPFVHAPRIFTDPRTSQCSAPLKLRAVAALFRLRWFRVWTGVTVFWNA